MFDSHTTHFHLPDTWRRADILIASFVINVLGLGLPIVILQVYDRIIPNAAFGTFWVLVLGLTVALGLETALRILRAMILSSVGARYEHRTGLAAFSALLDARIDSYRADTATSYTDRIRGLSAIRDFYAGQSAMLVIDLPFVVIFLVLIAMIGGALVLVPLVLLGVLLVLARYLGDTLTEAIEKRTETDRRRHNFLVETLQGMHSVKALALERVMVRRYERLQGKSAAEVMNLSTLHALSSNLANTFSQLGMVSFVAVGSLSVIDQTLTMGGLAAGTMLTGRVLQPVLRGFSTWMRLHSVRRAERRFNELFTLSNESQDGAKALEVKGHIRFENVSFRYSANDPYILEDVSLDIPAGTVIGLTGPNGCGLSTFLRLINGMCQPEKGRITIDGVDLREIDKASLRQQIGFMPEQGEFFHGSLLENLTMFREGAAKLRAVEVLRLLGLDKYVLRLPAGLETPLGTGVISRLPRGVRQQIIIARALVGDPPVVLFDNAHASLDLEADKRLKMAFKQLRGQKTMVLATYRPSFLDICDRVYIMKDGRLIERGQAQSAAAATGRSERLSQKAGEQSSDIQEEKAS